MFGNDSKDFFLIWVRLIFRFATDRVPTVTQCLAETIFYFRVVTGAVENFKVRPDHRNWDCLTFVVQTGESDPSDLPSLPT